MANKEIIIRLVNLAHEADQVGLYALANSLDQATDTAIDLNLSAVDRDSEKNSTTAPDAGRLELHVYDFDGTLFRSPAEPPWWPHGRNWWSWQGSLSSPCVPNEPDGSWWNSDVVSSAKRSIADQNVYAVLITGRQDSAFRWRVPELCSQAGLEFDEVHLSGGGSTASFKAGVVRGLCKKHEFALVRMWDDEDANHSAIASAVEVPVELVSVSAARKPVDCDMSEAIAAAEAPTKGADD